MREWLEALEVGAGEEVLPVLAYAAGLDIELGPDGPAAIRRAVLLLATGGDPLRGLDLDGRAVTALAADLDSTGRRVELAAGLATLTQTADRLPHLTAALARLASDADLAWHAFAAGVLADALGDDE
jgi:hypothetical protein